MAGKASGGADDAGRGRRLEILVHNISHKDMVLSLRRTRRAAAKPPHSKARPAGGGGGAKKAVSDVIDAVSRGETLRCCRHGGNPESGSLRVRVNNVGWARM